MPFISIPSTNSSRIASPLGDAASASCRCALDVVERLDAEDAALAARVGGLQHRREADLVGRAAALGERAHRGEARLRHAGLGEPRAHRDLVRHQVRGLRADPRQPARLGDRGDDRHRAVGADGQHAVELDARRRLQHGVDVREVDDLRDVRLREPERVRVPVDRRDAQSQLLRPQDRAALMAAGADEEDGPGHGAMLLGRRRPAVPRNRPISSIVTSSLVVAEVVSTTGTAMTFVALPWFVLVTTGSPAQMSLVLAVEIAPMALLGIPSGSLIGRLGARTTMLLSDALRAPLIALVPLLHWAGHLSFGHCS